MEQVVPKIWFLGITGICRKMGLNLNCQQGSFAKYFDNKSSNMGNNFAKIEEKHFFGQVFNPYLHIARTWVFRYPFVPPLLGGGTPKRADPPLARFWRLEKITDVAQQKGLIFFYYFSIRYTFRERGGFSLVYENGLLWALNILF